MFRKINEKLERRRQERQEEYEQYLRAERQRLLMMSEKELMVELLIKMDKISDQLEEIDTSIMVWND